MEVSDGVTGDSVYIAVHPYHGQREDIVSFPKGQLMFVSERPSETWWVAELHSGEAGYVPAAYLKVRSVTREYRYLLPWIRMECRNIHSPMRPVF